MRKSLQEYQDSNDTINTHQFLLAYYSNKIEDIDIKVITSEHETALNEAFYHAKESLETEDLLSWFISASDPFNRAAFWQLITPLYEEMLQILEAELGQQNPSVATALNNLAALYENLGDYEKALQLFQRALKTSEKALGSEHPYVAVILNNIALLYLNTEKYEESLPLYERSLKILERKLGPDHQNFKIVKQNIQVLKIKMEEK